MGSVDTSDIALQITQPTAAAGKDWVREVTLSGEFNPGLPVDGGSIHTNENDVTVIWDDK